MWNLWNAVCCFTAKQIKTVLACGNKSYIYSISRILLSIQSAERKGWRRTCHAGWTFLSERCAEQMLETDACDISQSGIIKALVWMTAYATFAQLLKHRQADVKLIHPGAITQWWWYICNQSPFHWEEFVSNLRDDSWITHHLSLRLSYS